MMRIATVSALALAACGQQAAQPFASNLKPCAELDLSGALSPAACQLQSSGQTLRVAYADLAAGTRTGAVSIDVLGHDGQVAQTLLEADVSEYLAPSLQDVDGDGRTDILIPRASGNVNTEYGVWIYDGTRYGRVGDINGVEVERTADGLIVVSARSSAVSWNVRYYRLDEGGLRHLVTAQIDGLEQLPDGSVRSACSVAEAPGLAELDLSARAAQERFCAEPASQVFAP